MARLADGPNHSQTVFYIERLQPDWLPGEKRWAFGLVYRLVGGLVVGLFAGLFVGLVDGLVVHGLFYVLVGGLVFGLFIGLAWAGFGLCSSEEIICVETVSWSWPKVRREIWSSGWSIWLGSGCSSG